MPYIEERLRQQYKAIDELAEKVVNSMDEGNINYIITRLLHKILEKWGLKYANINTLIGVLECCKLELYRKVAGPYENKKRRENGPISDLDSRTLNDVM